jgi:heme/copper-type cytochrome/quinol oxidase subunit 2
VLLIGLLCYLIQIFFSFSILIVAPFFWVLFGLLTASLREAKRSENQTAGQPA